MNSRSKVGFLATALLLTGCSPQGNAGDAASLSNDQIDWLRNFGNSTPAQREAARQAESLAEAASFQTILLILLLVVAVGILIAVLVSKSKKKSD
jgi:hypothetical protein